MTGEDSAENVPTANAPFARTIVWAVTNEERHGVRSVGFTTITSQGVVDRTPLREERAQTLAVAATIAGRARYEVVNVSAAEFESAQTGHSHQTSGRRYARRFGMLSALWIVMFALCWPLPLSPAIILFVVPLAVMFFTAPATGGAVVDFWWWSGHGFVNEVRTKWIITAVLWLGTIGPLALLQARV